MIQAALEGSSMAPRLFERYRMKLKFKHQPYQAAAVQAVIDVFKGQTPASAAAMSYRIDPGKAKKGTDDLFAVGRLQERRSHT